MKRIMLIGLLFFSGLAVAQTAQEELDWAAFLSFTSDTDVEGSAELLGISVATLTSLKAYAHQSEESYGALAQQGFAQICAQKASLRMPQSTANAFEAFFNQLGALRRQQLAGIDQLLSPTERPVWQAFRVGFSPHSEHSDPVGKIRRGELQPDLAIERACAAQERYQ